MPDFSRMSQWLKDVSRRAERVPPFGERTAQRHMITPTEIYGIEDSVFVSTIADRTRPMDVFLIYNGITGRIQIVDYNGIKEIFDAEGLIEIWTRIDSDGEANVGTLFDKVAYNLRTVEETDNYVNLRFTQAFSGTAGQWTTTNLPVRIGQNVHISLLYNNSNVNNVPTIFIDGIAIAPSDVAQNSTPVGTRTFDSPNDIYLGNRLADDRTLDGRIGYFRMWDSNHNTAALIQADMHRSITGAETGLQGYWKFEDGEGSSSANSVSGGNVASPLGGLPWGSLLAVGEGTARASETFVLLA